MKLLLPSITLGPFNIREKTIINLIKQTNTIIVLRHMLPHKVQQKLYRWAWQGGIKQQHKIHRVQLQLQNNNSSVHAPFTGLLTPFCACTAIY